MFIHAVNGMIPFIGRVLSHIITATALLNLTFSVRANCPPDASAPAMRLEQVGRKEFQDTELPGKEIFLVPLLTA